jgi:DNA repair photolyase
VQGELRAGAVAYREVECKTALNRVAGMPFDWSLNPFGGCAHRCTYCYAIAYRVKQDRDADSFHREIDVRVNFADVLERELRTRRYTGAVALGTATDPWQPIEGRYRLTRRVLELMAGSDLPLSIVTKSTMAVRDIDLLKRLAGRGSDMLSVCVSVAHVDREVWRRFEPGTPPPHQRLRLLARLRAEGIDAGVLCAPILPGVTDGDASLEAIASAAREHGATFFGWRPLKLDPGVRELYLHSLARELPVLVGGIRELYRRGPHAARGYQEELERRVGRIKARYGFGERRRAAQHAAEPRQLLLIA